MIRTCSMLMLPFTCLALSALAADAPSESAVDTSEVRDVSTLEMRILSDWRDDAATRTRQKLVEITVCEWWPGQNVRIPVAMIVPMDGGPCRHMLVEAMGVTAKRGVLTEWMKPLVAQGVGVVLAGVGTIEATPPVDALNAGMIQHLMETKDVRYTAAWFWGMSYMRAVTAALTEKEAFQPEKIAATGGSKRGIAAACATIHDDRFTAFMPIVAPALQASGGITPNPHPQAEFAAADQSFERTVRETNSPIDEPALAELLALEAERDARFSIDAFRHAGWTDADFDRVTRQGGELYLTTRHIESLAARGVEFCYQLGANDNASPDLVALGRDFPAFPLFILPGGHHGGPWKALARKTPTSPEIYANQRAFLTGNFLRDTAWPAMPAVSWDEKNGQLSVEVRFEAPPSDARIEHATLHWTFDRAPSGSLPYMFSTWDSSAAVQDSSHVWTASVPLRVEAKSVDLLATFVAEGQSLPMYLSTPYVRVDLNDEANSARSR